MMHSLDDIARLYYGADWSFLMQIYQNSVSEDLQKYIKSVSLYELEWCFGGANSDSPLTVLEKILYKNTDPAYRTMMMSSLPPQIDNSTLISVTTMKDFCQAAKPAFSQFLARVMGHVFGHNVGVPPTFYKELSDKIDSEDFRRHVVAFFLADAIGDLHQKRMNQDKIVDDFNKLISDNLNVSDYYLNSGKNSSVVNQMTIIDTAADVLQLHPHHFTVAVYHFMQSRRKSMNFLFAQNQYVPQLVKDDPEKVKKMTWLQIVTKLEDQEQTINRRMGLPMVVAAHRAGVSNRTEMHDMAIFELMGRVCDCHQTYLHFYYSISEEMGQLFRTLSVKDYLSKFGNANRMQILSISDTLDKYMRDQRIFRDEMRQMLNKGMVRLEFEMTNQNLVDFFEMTVDQALDVTQADWIEYRLEMSVDDIPSLLPDTKAADRYFRFRFRDWDAMYPNVSWLPLNTYEARKLIMGGGELQI